MAERHTSYTLCSTQTELIKRVMMTFSCHSRDNVRAVWSRFRKWLKAGRMLITATLSEMETTG